MRTLFFKTANGNTRSKTTNLLHQRRSSRWLTSTHVINKAQLIRRDLRNPQLALMIEPLEILEIFGMIHPTLQNPSIHERKVGWISNNLPSWTTSSKLFSMP